MVLSNEVIVSVRDWLVQQLRGPTVELNAGDVLEAEVEVNVPINRSPLKLDTGNDTLLEESDVVSLSVFLKGDPKWRVYSLRLLLCNEVQFKRAYDDPYYLGQPGNPMLAVLPLYEERNVRA